MFAYLVFITLDKFTFSVIIIRENTNKANVVPSG